MSLLLRWAPVYAWFRMHGHGRAWRIVTHMRSHERLLLYRLGLQQTAGAILVEVGSYLGASSCFLAAAAKDIGGELHCVDTWWNQGMSEGLRDTWVEFQKNTQPYSSLIIIPHRGLSVVVAATFERQIDLLFLDGDHSYEGCRADLLAWLPHCKPGCVLIMHDYGWAEGVQRVVEEIVQPREATKGHVLQNTYWTLL